MTEKRYSPRIWANASAAGFSSQMVWSAGMRPRATVRFITRTTIAQ